MSSIKELKHLRIPLDDIKLATNDFSSENFIGIGGFGKVYKGELSNSEGQIKVAVKRLDTRHGQGQHEFLMEITMLYRYQHKNIVSLLGFCDEKGEKLLVYEHMFHGSLDKYLRSTSLSWSQRLNICCDAARGLSYLHNPDGSQLRVLHRDIKSSNILLDENWCAKISDFGLSKLGPANQPFTFLVSHAAGTLGYCDPLYVETGILTKESDVYSFGVVLFEVLCGRLGVENYHDDRRFLARLAQKSYEQNKLDDIIDDNLKGQMDPASLATFSAIAYRCLRKDRDERPTMVEIVKELESALDFQEKRDANGVDTASYHANLLDAHSVLSAFKQYRLRVMAEVSHSTDTYIRSIQFDKDEELFAIAGCSKYIKIFDFAMIVSESLQEHDPVVEIPTSSELECLSWNKDEKNHLASSDYEGIVNVWDVNSQQVVIEYKEHEKRALSVDFSCMEPSMLASGGIDCKVKIWCTKQETSSINIQMKEPVDCVKYHPGSSMHIAVASADACAYYYDLRNTSSPLQLFKGHQGVVTYVDFLSNNELATSSTDNTLRLWDLKQNLPVRTFKGHKRTSLFVGFSVFNDFMACGSETNEAFVYHKTISKPLTWHQWDTKADDEGIRSPVVSDVCWKSDSPIMIAGNSKGTARVLVLET